MFILFLVFIVVPIAELYVIFQVGEAIGAVPTLALLIADSIIGTMLLRSQGRAVWRRFQETMQAGRMPHREVMDGVLVIFGGAFLITPGFITDIVGILCLLPPTRGVLRRLIVRVAVGRFRWFIPGAPSRPPSEGQWDVEGTAYEQPPDPPQLER